VDRIVDFLFEVGMLERTPRSGWQFLPGAASESVAEHVFSTAMVAFALARLDGTVDRARVVDLALVHDLAEARTGDLNYMNQRYVQANEGAAVADLTRDLPFAGELAALLAEFRAGTTREAILARDADQLQLLLRLKGELDAGHGAASEWMPFALKRLRTDLARELGARIVERDCSAWWFDRGSEWWVNRGE